MAAVALSGDEEIMALVLLKPLQPVDQEGIGVLCCSSVSIGAVI